MDKYYRLMTFSEWQEYEQDTQPKIHWHYNNRCLGLKPHPEKKGKRVKFYYQGEYQPIAKHITHNESYCEGFYQTLEKLGLYSGRNFYHHDDNKIITKLSEALDNNQAVLVEKEPLFYTSGLLIPKGITDSGIYGDKMPRKLTPAEAREWEIVQRYGNDLENWIEITVAEQAGQPFSLFYHGSQKLVYQGTLDGNGYAYVKLPVGPNEVDIVFDKQDNWRPWYLDMPLQSIGGIRDAAQSNLDIVWGLSDSVITGFSSQLLGLAHWLIGTKDNPVVLPNVSEPETVSGALTHGISQFLTDFLPTYRYFKFLKPVKEIGTLRRGAIAGVVADYAAFGPNEERLSNLIEEYSVLSNPITQYLQAKPDDSAAEGRLKNTIEGLLVGGMLDGVTMGTRKLATNFVQSLKALKYSRIKWIIPRARTRQHYKFEVVNHEAHNVVNYTKLKDDLVSQNLHHISKQDPRLEAATKGSGTKNPNFPVGVGTKEEADQLGKIWVGDGAKLVTNQKDCPGCLISVDGTRLYRPPTEKINTPIQFNPTGIQANYQILEINSITGKSTIISNGHMSIYK